MTDINKDSFAPYGLIIGLNPDATESFQVVLAEEDVPGWRIAVSNLTNKRTVKSLGLHPNTRESFEPLSGIAVIVVATKDEPDNIQAFLLDKPICLFKDTWHQLIALSETASVKIMENANGIESKGHNLAQECKVGLFGE
jgi:ureidoglycolate hydrolase